MAASWAGKQHPVLNQFAWPFVIRNWMASGSYFKKNNYVCVMENPNLAKRVMTMPKDIQLAQQIW